MILMSYGNLASRHATPQIHLKQWPNQLENVSRSPDGQRQHGQAHEQTREAVSRHRGTQPSRVGPGDAVGSSGRIAARVQPEVRSQLTRPKSGSISGSGSRCQRGEVRVPEFGWQEEAASGQTKGKHIAINVETIYTNLLLKTQLKTSLHFVLIVSSRV